MEAASSSDAKPCGIRECPPVCPVLLRKEDYDSCKGLMALFYRLMAFNAGVTDETSPEGQNEMCKIFTDVLGKTMVLTPTQWVMSVAGTVPFGLDKSSENNEPLVALAKTAIFRKKMSEMYRGYEPFDPSDYAEMMREKQADSDGEEENSVTGYEFVTSEGEEESARIENESEFMKIPMEQLYLMALISQVSKLSLNIQANVAANKGVVVHWQSTSFFNRFQEVMKFYKERRSFEQDNADFEVTTYASDGNIIFVGMASSLTCADIWALATGDIFVSCEEMESPVMIHRYWTETGYLLKLQHDIMKQEGHQCDDENLKLGLKKNPLRVTAQIVSEDSGAREYFVCPTDRSLLTTVHISLCEVIYQLFRGPLSGKFL